MIPGKHNFVPHKRGDTFNGHSFEIFVKVNEVLTPVNFTGAEILIQVKITPESNYILEWSTSNGGVTISGALNNVINMNVKTGLQMRIDPGIYQYDINVLLSNGVTNTYVEGTFVVVNNISKP